MSFPYPQETMQLVDPMPIAQPEDIYFLSRVLHIAPDAQILEHGDNWLAEALDIAADSEQWGRSQWLSAFDQLRYWRTQTLPGATFWRRAINRALERIIELLKKEA